MSMIIEKGIRTVIVPPTKNRTGYQYQRVFPDNKRENHKKTSRLRDGIETYSKNVLKAPIVKNLAICTDKEFSKYIDDMFNRNYKKIPAVIRLPDLNGKLTQKLHLANVHCYMEKKRFNHINPNRKASHSKQDFRKEEYKQIPYIIRNAKKALYDVKLHNFMLYSIDVQDKTIINTVAFNKDKNGNYLVTIGKKKLSSFGSGQFKVVTTTGVAPAIHGIKKSRLTSRLPASTATSSSLPHNTYAVNKSIYERVKEIFDMQNVVEKAGLPVGTISGNYKKISDNPSKWEYCTQKKQSKSLADIKTECFLYAKEHFLGKKIKNIHTGYLIEVSNKGLNEWVSKTKSLEQILSIKSLDKILINAKYTHSSENKHEHNINDKSTFDYFDCHIKINKKRFNVVLSIKSIIEGKGKNEKTRKLYYHHYLQDIKIEPSSSSPRVEKSTAALLLPSSRKEVVGVAPTMYKTIMCYLTPA